MSHKPVRLLAVLMGCLAVSASGCSTNNPPNTTTPCVSETDSALCTRLEKQCGALTATDNCGAERTVAECGPCTGTGEQCSAEGQCHCTAKTDAQLCADASKSCGPLAVTDNCGAARTVAECGPCTGTGEQCTADGQCHCTAKTDVQLCADASKVCGPLAVTDNCGVARTVGSCGECAGTGESCTAEGTCVCPPKTEAQLCADASKICGPLQATDNCGAARVIASCGICTGTGESCTAAGSCHCEPKPDAQLCFEAGAHCGPLTVTDNCGQLRAIATCGACPGPGESCTANNTCSCDPRTDAQVCASVGAVCGSLNAFDNCGRARAIFSCGSCGGTGESCEANRCACHPETDQMLCFAANARCGALAGVTDNCGATRAVASCGGCTGTGEACEANRCVCHPKTDAQLCADAGNANCGPMTVTDNCGASRQVYCGSCTGTGQGCEANHCTCHPKTDTQLCADASAVCGAISATDNCGASRTVASCGACTGTGEGCESNRCTCHPETDAQLCSAKGAVCGALTAADNCGVTRTVANCGTCIGTGESCDSQNHCGCTPKTDAQLCADAAAVCGAITATDNCGAARTVASCGQCVLPKQCSATRNVCTLPGVPLNDTCAGAEPLVFDSTGLAQVSADNTRALDDAASKNCGSSGPDLVYSLTLAQAQAVDVTLATPLWPTGGNSTIYLRSVCADNSTDLRCNTAATTALNAISLPRVEAGTYYLWVDASSLTFAGPFTLKVQLRAPAPLPANDTCAGATPVTLVGGYASIAGTTEGAHNDSRASCDASYPLTGPDVVYSITLATDSSVTAKVTRATTALSSYYPGVYIRANCASSAPADEKGCALSQSATPAIASANLTAGTYYVIVDGSASSGPFTLEVSATPTVTNSSCTAAMPLLFDANGVAAISGDTSFGGSALTATGCTSNGKELIYSVTLPQTATLEALVTPLSPLGQPTVYLQSTCGVSTSQKSCALASAQGKSVRTVAANLAAGTYYVVVDGYSSAVQYQGPFNLQLWLQPVAAPANATCTGAQPLSFDWSGKATVYASTENSANATSSNAPCASQAGPELVYSFTLASAAAVSAKVTRADTDAAFNPSVYLRGTCTDAATQQACSAIASSTVNGSWAIAPNLAAGTYYVFVDSAAATNYGYFTLEVKRGAVHTNDTCAGAQALSFDGNGVAQVSDDTSFALNDLAVSNITGCGSTSPGSDLIYSFTTTAEKDVTVQLTPAAGQTTRHTVYLRTTCASATWGTSELACTYAANPGDALKLLSRRLTAGTYYVVVDGYTAMNNGPFTLKVTAADPPAPPANDTCAAAQVLTFDPVTGHAGATGNTYGARDDYVGTGSCASGAPSGTPVGMTGGDVVYQFTLPVDSWVQAQVNRGAGDTFYKPQVYFRTNCPSNLAADQLACGSDFGSGIVFNSAPALAPANTPVYVVVDGSYNTSTVDLNPAGTYGAFTLDLWQRPVNSCASPTALNFNANGVATVSDDVSMEPTNVLVGSCGWSGRELVYSFTTTATKDIDVKVTPAPGLSNTKFSAYLRSTCAMPGRYSEVACGTSATNGSIVEVRQRLPANTWYLVVDSTTVSPATGAFTMTVTLSTPSPIVASNETCATATPLSFDSKGYATVNGTTVGAADDLAATWCGGAGAGDLVYTFNLAQPSSILVRVTRDLASPSYLPVVYVRSNCTSTSFADEQMCATNAPWAPSASVQATLKNLAAGTYYVIVDGANGSAGSFALELQTYPVLGNDSCASPNAALPLALDASGFGSASGDLYIADATSSTDGSCATSSGADVVYSVTITQPKVLRAQVEAVGGWGRTVAYVRTVCDDKGFEAACSLAPTNTVPADTTTVPLPAGTYFVWVDAQTTTRGPYVLRVWATDPIATAPANSTCATAAPLTFDSTLKASVMAETINAPNSKVGSCDGSTGGDVVYSFTTTAAQKVVATVTRDATTPAYNPVIYFRSTCEQAGLAGELTCAKGSGNSATINNLAAGTYYLIVDGTAGSVGRAALTVQLSAPVATGPANENCAGAIALDVSSGGATTFGTTVGAQNDAASLSTSCTAATAPDVVYSFTTTQTQSLTVAVTPDTPTTYHPGVFIRKSCGSVLASDEVACAAGSSPAYVATATVKVLPAGTYYVWVDSNAAATYSFGSFMLVATLAAPRTPPANDVCAGATALTFTSGVATVTGSTTDALNDTSSVSGSCTPPAAPDVVYSFTLTQHSSTRISVTPADSTKYRAGLIVRDVCDSALPRNELRCASNMSAPWVASTFLRDLGPGTYYVWVDGNSTYSSLSSGDFTLSVTLGTPVATPTNDNCANAVALTQGTAVTGEILQTFALDYGVGTSSLSEPCSTNFVRGPDAVYSYTPATTGNFTVTVADDWPVDAVVWYATGTCGGDVHSCLGYAASSVGGTATLTVSGVAGTTYFLYVASGNSNSNNWFGTYTIQAQ